VQALERLRLTDVLFFSASTGTNGCTILQCKHWKYRMYRSSVQELESLRLTDEH
jgi:hypothetical protein